MDAAPGGRDGKGLSPPVTAARGSPSWSASRTTFVEPLLGLALLVFTVAIEGDGAPRRLVGPETLALELDIQLLIEQPPPERHRFAGELRLDLV